MGDITPFVPIIRFRMQLGAQTKSFEILTGSKGILLDFKYKVWNREFFLFGQAECLNIARYYRTRIYFPDKDIQTLLVYNRLSTPANIDASVLRMHCQETSLPRAGSSSFHSSYHRMISCSWINEVSAWSNSC